MKVHPTNNIVYRASDKTNKMRAETMKSLGLTPVQAMMVEAMTNAYFAEGMARVSQMTEQLFTGKITPKRFKEMIKP